MPYQTYTAGQTRRTDNPPAPSFPRKRESSPFPPNALAPAKPAAPTTRPPRHSRESGNPAPFRPMPSRRQTRRTDNPPGPVIPAKAGIQDLSAQCRHAGQTRRTDNPPAPSFPRKRESRTFPPNAVAPAKPATPTTHPPPPFPRKRESSTFPPNAVAPSNPPHRQPARPVMPAKAGIQYLSAQCRRAVKPAAPTTHPPPSFPRKRESSPFPPNAVAPTKPAAPTTRPAPSFPRKRESRTFPPNAVAPAKPAAPTTRPPRHSRESGNPGPFRPMPSRRQTRHTDNPPGPVIPAKAGIQDLSAQ